MIKNLLFDLGGVFIELTRDEAVRRFEALGVHDANSLLDPYKQEGIFLGLESGKYNRHSFTQELNARYQLTLQPKDIEWALLGFVQNIQEYKFHFIETELPPHLRLLLISNTNPFVWEPAEQGLLLSNGRSFSSYFQHVTASFQVGHCKPELPIFHHVVEQTGIRPEETLFIDDGPANTALARQLGYITYCPENGEDWRPILRKMFI